MCVSVSVCVYVLSAITIVMLVWPSHTKRCEYLYVDPLNGRPTRVDQQPRTQPAIRSDSRPVPDCSTGAHSLAFVFRCTMLTPTHRHTHRNHTRAQHPIPTTQSRPIRVTPFSYAFGSLRPGDRRLYCTSHTKYVSKLHGESFHLRPLPSRFHSSMQFSSSPFS